MRSLDLVRSAGLDKLERFLAGDRANIADLLRAEEHSVVALGDRNHFGTLWDQRESVSGASVYDDGESYSRKWW